MQVTAQRNAIDIKMRQGTILLFLLFQILTDTLEDEKLDID